MKKLISKFLILCVLAVALAAPIPALAQAGQCGCSEIGSGWWCCGSCTGDCHPTYCTYSCGSCCPAL